ncbi:imm11 family protein [Bacteroides congonensis]|jgi:hypothetical protein|uniref:imm11 family protein n=1 Tax=Bacteroides congonensis TaxID=1871006 RepID=UPI001114EB5B|nr:DUF1629 domain-containing protein [Bacteroides congonensis]
MKYFIMEESLNEKIIGSDFPQVYKFIKGYDEDAPNALFSLYKYRNAFPDYVPNLDGVMLAGYAKLTDFISNGFSNRLRIISPRAKAILEQYNLCPHQFYPLGLYKRKIKHDYFLFKFVSDYSDFVDYEKTSFQEYDIISNYKSDSFFVHSKKDFWEKRNAIEVEKGVSWGIWGNNIVMNKAFDHKLDFFVISILDANTYVSERLKNAIETAGLTGWEFTPATNLIVED